MISGLWGKKIGMTQVFSEQNKVVPVTVVDIADWFVTNIKNQERDGYNAIQIGCVRKKYSGEPFVQDWLKNPKKYFEHVKEIRQEAAVENVAVGQPANFASELEIGKSVDVFGTTIGRGFQGVVKRHGFAGGPSSHGSTFHRRPGGMSFTRSRGRVIKGKKLPGHMGVTSKFIKNLQVVRVEPQDNVVLIRGSVPGKSGSLLYIRKAGTK